jgi:hypothetical protein
VGSREGSRPADTGAASVDDRCASALQQADGGWSTSSLGTFKRVDDTANDTKSDGYATALATLALQEAGVPHRSACAKGLEWLRRNQDRATGRWIATSLNKNRDPESEPAKFMNDARTLTRCWRSRTQGNEARS